MGISDHLIGYFLSISRPSIDIWRFNSLWTWFELRILLYLIVLFVNWLCFRFFNVTRRSTANWRLWRFLLILLIPYFDCFSWFASWYNATIINWLIIRIIDYILFNIMPEWLEIYSWICAQFKWSCTFTNWIYVILIRLRIYILIPKRVITIISYSWSLSLWWQNRILTCIILWLLILIIIIYRHFLISLLFISCLIIEFTSFFL